MKWRADGQAIGYAYLALTGPGDNAGRIAVQKQGRNSGLKEAVSFSGGEAKLVANWVMGELSAALNQNNLDITESPVNAERLGGLVARIADQTID